MRHRSKRHQQDLRFILSHFGLALSIVHAKSKVGLSDTRLARSSTNVRAGVLAKFAGILLHRIVGGIAIASVLVRIVGIIVGHTLGSVQANMFASRTNLQLMLALNAKVSFRTNTVFPEAVSLVELLELVSKLLKQLVVLLSAAALSTILALQSTLVGLLTISVFAHGSMESWKTLTTFVSVAVEVRGNNL